MVLFGRAWSLPEICTVLAVVISFMGYTYKADYDEKQLLSEVREGITVIREDIASIKVDVSVLKEGQEKHARALEDLKENIARVDNGLVAVQTELKYK